MSDNEDATALRPCLTRYGPEPTPTLRGPRTVKKALVDAGAGSWAAALPRQSMNRATRKQQRGLAAGFPAPVPLAPSSRLDPRILPSRRTSDKPASSTIGWSRTTNLVTGSVSRGSVERRLARLFSARHCLGEPAGPRRAGGRPGANAVHGVLDRAEVLEVRGGAAGGGAELGGSCTAGPTTDGGRVVATLPLESPT